MATRSVSKPARAIAPPASPFGHTEDTAPEIRAYLASMRPWRVYPR